MREILFRGKRCDNGEWIAGSLWINIDRPLILSPGNGVGYPVCRATVGQYTGLKDKNGAGIFEGDILKDDWGKIYKIFFSPEKCAFLARIDHAQNEWEKGNYCMGVDWCDTIRVIGNIHDNPELLEA